MSYTYYMQHMHQLMAMGLCGAAVNFSTMGPLVPTFVPIQNVQYNSTIMDGNTSVEIKSDECERSLFCANLHENVSDELLYEAFLQAGPIEKVYIPKDGAGKRRSYGFVIYKYRSSALYAMQLYQGLVLFDKRLDIKYQGNYNANGINAF